MLKFRQEAEQRNHWTIPTISIQSYVLNSTVNPNFKWKNWFHGQNNVINSETLQKKQANPQWNKKNKIKSSGKPQGSP